MRRHHHHGRRGRTLRRALLLRFIAAVVVTGASVSLVFWLGGQERNGFGDEVARVAAYVTAAIEAHPEQRNSIINDASMHLATRLVLRDEHGVVVVEAGAGQCRHPLEMPIAAGGTLQACRPSHGGPPLRGVAAAVVVAITVLALFAGAMARRIAWPLRQLAETARKIGEGDLRARPTLGRRPFVEVRLVAEALADMAGRIERELGGQRALLAGVSHELRTPLGHLRLLIETARDAPPTQTQHLLDEIETEVLELDSLLAKLLAQARLDFARLDRRPVDMVDVATRALQRAGVEPGLLSSSSPTPLVWGDATLLSRALANLLENAQVHGGGVSAVSVQVDPADPGSLRIAVDDEGPGVGQAFRERIFLPFVNSNDRAKGSLGLGLHLVRRIAEAHGGSVVVDDRSVGARFVLTLPVFVEDLPPEG